MPRLVANAGELRERVAVATRTVATTAGEQTSSFANEGPFRAKVVPMRSQDVQADVDHVTETCQFVFRRHSVTEGITAGDRLTWGSRQYHVVGEPHLSDTQFLAVIGERGTPNALDG